MFFYRTLALGEEDYSDYSFVTSFEADFTGDDVPNGSVLTSVSSQIIQDELVCYTRCWRPPQYICITGLQYLRGHSWLSKIDNLFHNCEISPDHIALAKNKGEDAIEIHFNYSYVKKRVKKIVEHYLKRFEMNNVFVA